MHQKTKSSVVFTGKNFFSHEDANPDHYPHFPLTSPLKPIPESPQQQPSLAASHTVFQLEDTLTQMFDLLTLRVQPHIGHDQETLASLRTYQQLSLNLVKSLKQTQPAMESSEHANV